MTAHYPICIQSKLYAMRLASRSYDCLPLTTGFYALKDEPHFPRKLGSGTVKTQQISMSKTGSAVVGGASCSFTLYLGDQKRLFRNRKVARASRRLKLP